MKNKIIRLEEDNKHLAETVKRQKVELLDIKSYNDKLESTERKLRHSLREKENEIESERLEYMKLMNIEKKKCVDMQE